MHLSRVVTDELEHVKTMALCQDYDSLEKLVSADGSDGDGEALAARDNAEPRYVVGSNKARGGGGPRWGLLLLNYFLTISPIS